jgi:haloacetate dehalogenase
MAEYERCIQDPATVHGVCEDYRASATIDLEHDRADRRAGRKLTTPTMVLWGTHGVIQRCFEPLKEWQHVATDVRGHAVPSGHYIAEEIPEVLLETVGPFLRG